MGFYSDFLYENAITWTTDGANAGTVNYREGKFYCTNVCGVLLNSEGYSNRCVAEILGRISKKYVSYVGNPKLMNNVMAEISIRIPTLREQTKISEFIKSLDRKISAQMNLIASLKKYKRGLISAILSEKISVSNTDTEWEEVSLSDVATGFEYGMNSAAGPYDGKHKYIRITDIDDELHTYDSSNPVSPSDDVDDKYRVMENDILFARTGASVGKSYLYNANDGELYFAGFLIRIHVKENYDSRFIYMNTISDEYDRWVKLESMRSGQPGINAEQYRNYKFKVPSLPLQTKIANVSSLLDRKIMENVLFLEKMQRLKTGLLQNMFV